MNNNLLNGNALKKKLPKQSKKYHFLTILRKKYPILGYNRCNKSLKRKVMYKNRLRTFYFAGEPSRRMRRDLRKKDPV